MSFEHIIFGNFIGGVPLGTYLMVGVTTVVMAFVTAYDTSPSTDDDQSYDDDYGSGSGADEDYTADSGDVGNTEYEPEKEEPDNNNLEYDDEEHENEERPSGGRRCRRRRRPHTTPRSRPAPTTKHTIRRRR